MEWRQEYLNAVKTSNKPICTEVNYNNGHDICNEYNVPIVCIVFKAATVHVMQQGCNLKEYSRKYIFTEYR